MCGIAGIWEFKADSSEERLKETMQSMTETISHRGPDGAGLWSDKGTGLAFGHRRLSIIDLSNAGSQPMLSKNGRYVITFNGEIYNFKEIRKELEGRNVKFQGHSDTEVLIEAISTWGLELAIEKCIGMFAFGLWDRTEHLLHLVRDRMGVKPLYYTIIPNRALLFASQSKCFLKYPYFHPKISLESAAGYFQYGYLLGSRSIYENTVQVLPGHIVTIHPGGEIKQLRYWSIPRVSNSLSNKQATDKLEEILESAIKLRMRSDVPLGVFLSGGIDSSIVTAFMQKNSVQKIKTFCIGFSGSSLDESRFAKKVASHLGTDHTEIIMNNEDLFSLIPTLPDFFDEPFADFSMLPTMLVSKGAREHVTVALSGDGGDELFAGYNRYKVSQSLLKIPPAFLHMLSPITKYLSFNLLEKLGKAGGIKITQKSMVKLKEIAAATSKREMLLAFYRSNLWNDGESPLIEKRGFHDSHERYIDEPLTTVDDMQRLDAQFYLPDDILTKVDRSSMAYGLEAREPLLDHRLVEFAFSLPLSCKLHKGKTKYILRNVLYKYLPPTLIDRPKQGFTPPLHEWLRGPLHDWAADLINSKTLTEDGILDEKIIKRAWSNHLNGTEDNSSALWSVLMFQSWKQNYSL